MARRILAILRARLAAQLGGGPPWAALLAQGFLAAVLCLIARDELGAWGFAVVALSLSAGLVLLGLLGEFGGVLRRDPAGEWAEALPASPFERRAARFLLVAVLLAGLCLAVGVPAALFAPTDLGVPGRALLLATLLAQAVGLAALLLALAALLGERAEGLLVLAQTALVALAVGALLASPLLFAGLRAIEADAQAAPAWLAAWPPATLAGAVAPAPDGAPSGGAWAPALALAAGAALLLAVPPAPEGRGRRSTTPLSQLLAPVTALAARWWVRDEERASFHLVHDALPLERDFVLRTYPMIGLPLAFFLVGAKGDEGPAREGLLTLLLFTPAIYLPVLLAHVPATSSPRARWMLDCAPVTRAAIRGGAIKALAVRFVLPLYVALAGLAAVLSGPLFALRMAPAGFLVTLAAMRMLYPHVAADPPLSVPADEIEVKHDWTGMLATLAFVLVILATAAQFALASTLPRAALFTAALLALEWRNARADRALGEPG